MMTGLVNDKLIPIFLEAAGIACRHEGMYTEKFPTVTSGTGDEAV